MGDALNGNGTGCSGETADNVSDRTSVPAPASPEEGPPSAKSDYFDAMEDEGGEEEEEERKEDCTSSATTSANTTAQDAIGATHSIPPAEDSRSTCGASDNWTDSCGSSIPRAKWDTHAVGSHPWKALLMQRVAERDHKTEGLAELYARYKECLRSLKVRTGSFSGDGECPWIQNSEEAGGLAASCAVSSDAQGARPRREAEFEALRQIIQEREEELREKEEAHMLICRQATQLGRENAELKEQLAKVQEQLHAKMSENDRLCSEMRLLRESSPGDFGDCSLVSDAEAPSVLPSKQCIYRKIHAGELTCIAAATTQGAPLPRQLVAVGTEDGFVKLLDGETIRPHAQVSVSRELPRLLLVDLGPGLLLAAAADHAVRLLDLRAQKLVHVLRGHLGTLSACGFLRSNAHAFTASVDRTVKLWDLEKGQTIRSYSSSTPISSAAAHAGSGVIALGHDDGCVAVWDPRAVDRAASPASIHDGSAVTGVRFSPDGRSLLTQAMDGVVCTTAVESMNPVLRLEGTGTVRGSSPPAWSSDGAHILVRCADCIRCWNSASGELIHAHETPVPAGLSWDLPRAISAHRNGDVALWGNAFDSVGA